jgi:hypothetical protein
MHLLTIAVLGLTATNASFANPAHEQLMRMSGTERNAALTNFLKSSGEKCDSVTRSFFQGSDRRGNAFWNAACRNGQAFVIQVNNDAVGSTRIMSCAMLKAMNAGECFKKF